MAPKNSAEIDTGFPIYGLRFLNNHTLLACGGGGEGNNGIPNKVTAIRCSFTVSDKSRRLQRFREITLPSNEDSPMCIEFCRSTSGDNNRYSIFVGCNQSTELIRSMNINNNLRKYNYTDDEHLQFSDAVQFDGSLSVESIGEYPKIVHLSSDASIGGMMTSRIPSEIFIFNPDSLELKLRFKPSAPGEIKDFHLSVNDTGNTLTYVTASLIETISTNSGSLLGSSSTADKKSAKTLAKYFFSKVRYVDGPKVIVTAALRNGKGAAVLEYNTETRRVTRERVISNKIKGIVAIDVSKASGLVAVAGNDFSVSLLRLSDLKVIKTYNKLHKFAVTCLSFSPDGKKLATGSASNTLSVLLVKSSSGGFFSFIYSLFRFLFFAALVAIFAAFVQRAHENGELTEYIELSKVYGSKALVHAQHYQKVGTELSQKYGKEYFELSQHYGKIGFDLAKEQASRGVELLKEQIDKRTAPKEEKPDVSKPFADTTSLPNWADEGSEKTYTIQSDIVSQYTKDIHELTRDLGGRDTLSIIEEAVSYTMIASIPEPEEFIASETHIAESTAQTLTSLESESSVHTESASEVIDTTASTAFREPSNFDEISPQEEKVETYDSPLSSSIVEDTVSAQESGDSSVIEPPAAETPLHEKIADVPSSASSVIAEITENVPAVESVISHVQSDIPSASASTSVSESVEFKGDESSVIDSTVPETASIISDSLTQQTSQEVDEPKTEDIASLLSSELTAATDSVQTYVSSFSDELLETSSIISQEIVQNEPSEIPSFLEDTYSAPSEDSPEASSEYIQTVADPSVLDDLSAVEQSEYSAPSEEPTDPAPVDLDVFPEETSSLVAESEEPLSIHIEEEITSSTVTEDNTTSSILIEESATSVVNEELEATKQPDVIEEVKPSIDHSGEILESHVSEPILASSFDIPTPSSVQSIVEDQLIETIVMKDDLEQQNVSETFLQTSIMTESETKVYSETIETPASQPSEISVPEPSQNFNVESTVDSQTPPEQAPNVHDEL